METLLNNLITAAGWSILHSLWQGALIYALLLPSQINVFGLKAKVKYALAYGAHCLMFCCFLFTFFSVFHWPLTQQISPAGFDQLISAAVNTTDFTLSQYAEMAFPMLVLLYTLGLFIQSYLVYKGYRKVQMLKNAAHQNVPAEWHILFSNLTSKLNIKKHISFKLSSHVQVPLVIGYVKPVILFPLALALQMDMQQVEAILIHELSHVRRNDYLLNLVKTMIDTILFFNPFIWLCGKFITIEREHACDDQVISLTKTPLTYAHALLKLELLADKSSPALSLAATGNKQHLYQRIKRITDMKTNYMNSKQKLFAITLTFATIVSLAWISPAKKVSSNIDLKITKDVKTIQITSDMTIDTGKKKNKIFLRTTRKTKKRDIASVKILDTTTGAIWKLNITPKNSGNYILVEGDSLYSKETLNKINSLSINAKKLVMEGIPNKEELNKIRVKIQENGLALQKEFNSPEQKEKLRKYAKEALARNKGNKNANRTYTMDALYRFDPDQVLANGKLIYTKGDVLNLEHTQLKLEKMKSDDVSVKVDGQVLTIGDTKINLGGNNITIYSENDEVKKVKQTPEYLELKKKFDKDVDELVNKKIKNR